MAGVLSSISSVVTAAAGWMGSVASTVTGEGGEIYLIFTAIPLVGLGIGLFKRLAR